MNDEGSLAQKVPRLGQMYSKKFQALGNTIHCHIQIEIAIEIETQYRLRQRQPFGLRLTDNEHDSSIPILVFFDCRPPEWRWLKGFRYVLELGSQLSHTCLSHVAMRS